MGGGDDIDTPAGVPDKGAQERMHWIMAGAIGIPIVSGILYLVISSTMATTFATTVAEIGVADLGVPIARPLRVAPDTLLTFAVSTGYSYSGNVDVMLSVALEHGGAEAAKTECNMKSLGGMTGGSGSGANTWYGDAGWTCRLTAPPTGADSIRVEIKKRGKGSLTLRKPFVVVKKP